MHYILSIDQGTTSSRAILFDDQAKPAFSHSIALAQIFPQAGWVEHNAIQIWQDVLACCRAVLGQVDVKDVKAIAITNQRETTVLWNKETGIPVHNALVWQDGRTADYCQALAKQTLANDDTISQLISQKTGLRLAPYFSASKLNYLLKDPFVRQLAEDGALCFGTIDSWLLFKLSNGKTHATDATNASRTMLYDIYKGQWDDQLLEIFDIPKALLPEVKNCQDDYGLSDASLFGQEIPICAIAGDQHAATYGQGCFEVGMGKATFGTGLFMMVNTGNKPIISDNQLLTTPSWQLEEQTSYALEGSVFMAGATMQWLRDNLGLFSNTANTGIIAQNADPDSGVYLVPAFQGLGAPYWDAEARAAITGMSRATGKAEIIRAGLESVAYQTKDLVDAISADMKQAGLPPITILRTDGGMTQNDWFMQFLTDILDMPVDCAAIAETTALGAALHGGQYCGLYGDQAALSALIPQTNRHHPAMRQSKRDSLMDGWKQAVGKVRG